MTFNVHLAQFDATPTCTRAGILLICDYFINELIKKMTMMLYGSMKMMFDTMNVSDINCPNENNGTPMPVINYIKEWMCTDVSQVGVALFPSF